MTDFIKYKARTENKNFGNPLKLQEVFSWTRESSVGY